MKYDSSFTLETDTSSKDLIIAMWHILLETADANLLLVWGSVVLTLEFSGQKRPAKVDLFIICMSLCVL